MTQKDFFQQLKAELQKHPYKERYLEELQAHAEDLEVEKLEAEKWEKRMGQPEQVKNNFLNIMNPFGKLFFILEGLFYGFLAIPFTVIFFTVNKWQQIDPNTNFNRLIIGILLCAIFIFLMFYFAFRRYQEVKATVQYKAKLWTFCMIIPGMISLSLLIFFSFSEVDPYRIGPRSALIMMSIYTLINLIGAYFAWLLSKNKKKPLKTNKYSNLLKYILIIYIALGIIIKTLFTYLPGEPSNFLMIIGAPFFPIVSLEYMFMFFWSGMMNFSEGNQINLFITFYFPIIIFFFLGLQSLWVIWKEKKWFSLRALIVLYTVSLLLIPGPLPKAQPQFKVPAINISEFIEKKELGILYGIIKYFNQDEGLIFKYEVGLDSQEGLVVKSNTGKMYYFSKEFIDSPNIMNPTFENIFDGVMQVGKDESLHGINLPKFPCTKTEQEECNLNSYINRYILNLSVPASDGYFSKDGKWALIVIPTGAYDPENVYLVKIK